MISTFINQNKLSFSMNIVRINIKVKKFRLFYKFKTTNFRPGKRQVKV
jgi:hypothetical protein